MISNWVGALSLVIVLTSVGADGTTWWRLLNKNQWRHYKYTPPGRVVKKKIDDLMFSPDVSAVVTCAV